MLDVPGCQGNAYQNQPVPLPRLARVAVITSREERPEPTRAAGGNVNLRSYF